MKKTLLILAVFCGNLMAIANDKTQCHNQDLAREVCKELVLSIGTPIEKDTLELNTQEVQIGNKAPVIKCYFTAEGGFKTFEDQSPTIVGVYEINPKTCKLSGGSSISVNKI